MKPVLLFAGSHYYPSGGWGDFKGSFETTHAALVFLATESCDWFHMIDRDTGKELEV